MSHSSDLVGQKPPSPFARREDFPTDQYPPPSPSSLPDHCELLAPHEFSRYALNRELTAPSEFTGYPSSHEQPKPHQFRRRISNQEPTLPHELSRDSSGREPPTPRQFSRYSSNKDPSASHEIPRDCSGHEEPTPHESLEGSSNREPPISRQGWEDSSNPMRRSIQIIPVTSTIRTAQQSSTLADDKVSANTEPFTQTLNFVGSAGYCERYGTIHKGNSRYYA
jgi:hypothetical protein